MPAVMVIVASKVEALTEALIQLSGCRMASRHLRSLREETQIVSTVFRGNTMEEGFVGRSSSRFGKIAEEKFFRF